MTISGTTLINAYVVLVRKSRQSERGKEERQGK